ncbi:MAG: KamA family radical SAM protein [Bdellovibrionaceae bacterium]|nr:KamA family radical SAM protein [Pseudobdellovibrionaceae bacterium]
MKLQFSSVSPRVACTPEEWNDWRWQFRMSLKSEEDFGRYFSLAPEEVQGFHSQKNIFRAQTTPYYASLADQKNPFDPIRLILMPRVEETQSLHQEMLDPLGERKPENHPRERLIHRYSDRVLFLLTDLCSVYCRYCTRKHFTANDHAFVRNNDYLQALDYIRTHSGIREVILSGGDPLTISDSHLERVLSDLRTIEHVEIIRIHTRMPVVAPMRISEDLCRIIKKHKPVYLITHFNHPREVTVESAMAVEKLVDHGVPVLNQMVLLNGVNNHAAIVQALSRRLLYVRVKPYYMFQCDPSLGSDHLRTSIEESLRIQRELWGHVSGLAMPTYIVDIPEGGGKAALTPNFLTGHQGSVHRFKGWDGVEAEYHSPSDTRPPMDLESYQDEWNELKNSKASL